MSNNPTEHLSDEPVDGPVDRPNGSIDDDSVHPLTDPDDETTGNVDPVVPLGNADADHGGREARDESEGNEATKPAEDARLMGSAGN
jgi:hypothetical protein